MSSRAIPAFDDNARHRAGAGNGRLYHMKTIHFTEVVVEFYYYRVVFVVLENCILDFT